jgi:ATP-dependent helicase HrpB
MKRLAYPASLLGPRKELTHEVCRKLAVCARIPPVSREPLPIDVLLERIVLTLRDSRALVLQAEPGAGKTTRVPPALLEAGLAGTGELLVAEPRRLAARLAADRVAAELGEPVGGLVGYSVRFEEVASPRTRLRYVTDGVLLRRLVADPLLRGVGLVVIDELHERQIGLDVSRANASPDFSAIAPYSRARDDAIQ